MNYIYLIYVCIYLEDMHSPDIISRYYNYINNINELC